MRRLDGKGLNNKENGKGLIKERERRLDGKGLNKRENGMGLIRERDD